MPALAQTPGVARGAPRQLSMSSRERLALAGGAHMPVRCRRARSSWRSAAVAVAQKEQVIAITGATGFVGRKLVADLLGQGAKVKVLTRFTPGWNRFLSFYPRTRPGVLLKVPPRLCLMPCACPACCSLLYACRSLLYARKTTDCTDNLTQFKLSVQQICVR